MRAGRSARERVEIRAEEPAKIRRAYWAGKRVNTKRSDEGERMKAIESEQMKTKRCWLNVALFLFFELVHINSVTNRPLLTSSRAGIMACVEMSRTLVKLPPVPRATLRFLAQRARTPSWAHLKFKFWSSNLQLTHLLAFLTWKSLGAISIFPLWRIEADYAWHKHRFRASWAGHIALLFQGHSSNLI